MAQILKPYPMFFQARLLFILYGPTDLENGKFSRRSLYQLTFHTIILGP